MIINQSFKEAITQNSPRIAFRLTDTITNEVITSIGDGLLIEAPYDFISDSFVGEFPIWKLKAKFMYLENKISYVDHEFLAEIGAYSHDGDSWGEVNWINVGYFRVAEDGQETDDIQKQITLTMYDLGEALDKRYDPLSFPLTGLQIRTQIASRAGLEFAVEQEELLYDDYTFNSINVGAGQAITDREVLRQYAQLNMASGYLDRNGKIIIKSVFNADAVDAEISNYDYSELKLELPYGPLNSLIYSNKAEGDEHSYQDIEAKDQTSITENGKKSLEFSNNIFLDPLTLEEQQLEVDKLFSIINGFSYTPFDLDYFARPDLDPYDLIKIKNMQGDEFFAPLTNMSFNFNGGLIGTLDTKELPETLPKNEIPNIFERLDNAEIRVDRVNQKITSEVSNRETQVGSLEDIVTEQSTLISQTENKIETEITERIQQGEDIKEELTEFKQTSESFQFQVKHSNGRNLLKNSVMYNDNTFWEAFEFIPEQGDLINWETWDSINQAYYPENDGWLNEEGEFIKTTWDTTWDYGNTFDRVRINPRLTYEYEYELFMHGTPIVEYSYQTMTMMTHTFYDKNMKFLSQHRVRNWGANSALYYVIYGELLPESESAGSPDEELIPENAEYLVLSIKTGSLFNVDMQLNELKGLRLKDDVTITNKGLYGEVNEWSLSKDSKHCITGKGLDYQTIPIEKKDKYTLSFDYRKPTQQGTIYVYYEIAEERINVIEESGIVEDANTSIELENLNINEITIGLENLNINEITIGIEFVDTSEEEKPMIANLLFVKGGQQTWTPAIGEVHTVNVLIDETGIKVKSKDGLSYTSMTPDEFAHYYDNQKTFDMNRLEARFANVKITGQSFEMVGGIKFVNLDDRVVLVNLRGD